MALTNNILEEHNWMSESETKWISNDRSDSTFISPFTLKHAHVWWAITTRPRHSNGWLDVGRLLQEQFICREFWELIWTPKTVTLCRPLTCYWKGKIKPSVTVFRRDGFMSLDSKDKWKENDKSSRCQSLGRNRRCTTGTKSTNK